MEGSAQSSAQERACFIESHQEFEATLRSLRSLICDLLRENQELRTVLLTQRDERIQCPESEVSIITKVSS